MKKATMIRKSSKTKSPEKLSVKPASAVESGVSTPCQGSGDRPTSPPEYRWENLGECPRCKRRVGLTRARVIARHAALAKAGRAQAEPLNPKE